MNPFYMHVETLATSPRPLQRWDSPWAVTSTFALIQVEDILIISCELWLDKQQQFNSY